METKFRFKKFKVYQDSKTFCKFCRDIVEKQIRKKIKGLLIKFSAL